MTIRVVTDSTCDLPQSLIAQHAITVVPLYVSLGGRSYRDGVDLSREEFYARLPSCVTPPTTASPGPAVFVETYRRLVAEGATGIVSVHLTSALSNIYNIARAVAAEIAHVPVRVVDSGNFSLGTGLAAVAASTWAAAGATLDGITHKLTQLAKRCYSYAVLDTLEFVRRSGRISSIVSTLGTLLHVRPLLGCTNGSVSVERLRTQSKAMARLCELARQLSPLSSLTVLHTGAPERAEALRQLLAELFPPESSLPQVLQAGSVVGVHMGPGAVGFTALSEAEA